MKEVLQQVYIFHSRSRLELAVEVYADALRMVEGTQPVSVVRSNATTKQERRLSRVSLKHRPVVFLSAATVAFAFRVEEKEVDMPLILFATFQVLSTGYADGNHAGGAPEKL